MKNFFKEKIKKKITSEEKDIKDIWRRIRKRDFSGNTGLVVKNSIYQFSTNSVAKIGSLIFTVILARMLMPELFGLYNLALSTILIFAVFSNLGIGQILIRFVSREFGRKNKKKAKSYVLYLGKLKSLLVFISILILVISARFISNNYYQKPLFLALIAGSLYILFTGITRFLQSLLLASNYFNSLFYKEIIFQIVRLILIPLVILLSLKQLSSNESILFFIILGLSFSYLIASIFLLIFSKNKLKYLTEKKKKISSSEKKKVNKFILPISITTITTAFFGYIDIIMLGRFVLPEYIGYYGAALSLAVSVIPLITFSVVLLPIFSRIKNQQLERGFKKIFSMTLLLSLMAFLFVLVFSSFIINFVYGIEYASSINILRFFSLLLISAPIISIYNSYFIARGKPGILAKFLIVSLIVNIILNLLAIFLLRNYGGLSVVYGITGATIFSRWFYMFSLILMKKRIK
jgi:O-antigen/teichoic acid export membrane protein